MLKLTDEEEYANFTILFWKELSNGALVFQIIDDDYNPAGHIIVFSSTEFEILPDGFHNFKKEDIENLEKELKEFCKVAKKI